MKKNLNVTSATAITVADLVGTAVLEQLSSTIRAEENAQAERREANLRKQAENSRCNKRLRRLAARDAASRKAERDTRVQRAEARAAVERSRQLKELGVGIPASAEEELHYFEGHALAFASDEARVAFEAGLLENARPTAIGHFGGRCWDQFEKEHPDWSETDFAPACMYSWCGGGFYTLPTVELMEGGTVLFCSEEQWKAIEGGESPWLCKATLPNSDIYVGVDDIDEVVVLPDEVVGKIEIEAAERIKADGGKLLAIDGWEVPLDENQKPRGEV